jgi:hypothetical protein
MDPVKVVIFALAFLALLVLGRKLSSADESPEIAPLPEPLPTETVTDEEPETSEKTPAIIGADLPFPIYVPEIKRDKDGNYNRPEFLNYYFEERICCAVPKIRQRFMMIFILRCGILKTVTPRSTGTL